MDEKAYDEFSSRFCSRLKGSAEVWGIVALGSTPGGPERDRWSDHDLRLSCEVMPQSDFWGRPIGRPTLKELLPTLAILEFMLPLFMTMGTKSNTSSVTNAPCRKSM